MQNSSSNNRNNSAKENEILSFSQLKEEGTLLVVISEFSTKEHSIKWEDVSKSFCLKETFLFFCELITSKY